MTKRALPCTWLDDENEPSPQTLEKPVNATLCEIMQKGEVGAAGFEHLSNSAQNNPSSPSAAHFPAHSTQTPPTDPDLTSLIAAWPTLPPALKAGITAMVKAAGAS